MSTQFPGFGGPSASVEAPLEMLAACHMRILRQCDTLERLISHLQTNGVDQQARQAASNIMRYFNTAAIDHHADEEQDLFPAMLESVGGSDAVCIKDLIYTLENQHAHLERLWIKIKPNLNEISNGIDSDVCNETIRTFVNSYRTHIKLENEELLPLANRILDISLLNRIGESMRVRRGIKYI